jgi:hypothetical protein
MDWQYSTLHHTLQKGIIHPSWGMRKKVIQIMNSMEKESSINNIGIFTVLDFAGVPIVTPTYGATSLLIF